jgi:hypothetical protein
MSISSAVVAAQRQVLGPNAAIAGATSVARATARAEAYQLVTASAASVIATSAQTLQSITLMSQAAMAVIVKNMLKAPPVSVVQWSPAIPAVGLVAAFGVEQLTRVTSAATQIVTEFPAA